MIIFIIFATLNFYSIFKNKKILFWISIIFYICSYDFILPIAWTDSYANIKVVEEIENVGMNNFLYNYHNYGYSYLIDDSRMLEKFEGYQNYLPLKFRKFDVDKYQKNKIKRVAKHPPGWFSIMYYWKKIFGGTFLSYKILQKLIAISILLLISRFITENCSSISKLQSMGLISCLSLMPNFLEQTTRSKNDLILYFFMLLLFYFIFKNNKNNNLILNCLIGIIASICILIKFTSIIILIPLSVYLFVNNKRLFCTVLTILLSSLILPFLLYVIFEYNLILNFIMGKAEQSVKVMDRVTSIPSYLFSNLIYGQYRIGIPMLIVLVLSFFKMDFNNKSNLISIFFFLYFIFITFILWGSNIPRHSVAFIPLLIPILIYAFKNNKYEKYIFITLLFMILNNFLLILNRLININLLNGNYIIY